MTRRWLVFAVPVLVTLAPATAVAAGLSLRSLNESLVRLAPDGGRCARAMRRRLANLPRDVRIRPDLERLLDDLASTARRRAGLPAVTASDAARLAARAQAADMLIGGYVGHYAYSGCTFDKRFLAAAGPGHGSHGENAARDRRRGPVDAAKARRLFHQWLESGAHRRNLMRPGWRYVSSGAIARGHHLYAVQIYWQR